MSGPLRFAWLALMLLVLAPAAARAQSTVRLYGVTRETGTATPIAGVEVLVDGVARSVFSDAQGRFSFDSLPAGRLAITARLPGYSAARMRIAIDPGVALELDLQLTPLESQLPQILPEVVIRGERLRGLYGVVSDRANQPVAGAMVHVYGGGASQRVDSTGRFAFPGIKSGSYLVSAELKGLTGKPLQVSVPNGGYREVVLRLAPEGPGQSAIPGQEWIYHELGMRLSFQPNSTRMTREELARYGSNPLCDIPRIRAALVDDTPKIIVDGITVLEEWPLCNWFADELDLVEWGSCVAFTEGMDAIPLSGRSPGPMQMRTRNRKKGCIMVWRR